MIPRRTTLREDLLKGGIQGNIYADSKGHYYNVADLRHSISDYLLPYGVMELLVVTRSKKEQVYNLIAHIHDKRSFGKRFDELADEHERLEQKTQTLGELRKPLGPLAGGEQALGPTIASKTLVFYKNL